MNKFLLALKDYPSEKSDFSWNNANASLIKKYTSPSLGSNKGFSRFDNILNFIFHFNNFNDFKSYSHFTK